MDCRKQTRARDKLGTLGTFDETEDSVGEIENYWDSAGSGSSVWYWAREKEAQRIKLLWLCQGAVFLLDY